MSECIDPACMWVPCCSVYAIAPRPRTSHAHTAQSGATTPSLPGLLFIAVQFHISGWRVRMKILYDFHLVNYTYLQLLHIKVYKKHISPTGSH